ncbi:MAG: hypothetical protein KDB61_13285, partial [Planctomycetes bacterium]|nr:hypothetical protein [Planctomycetota bacterium]
MARAQSQGDGLAETPIVGPSPALEAQARTAYEKLVEKREADLIEYSHVVQSKQTDERRERAFQEF